MTRIHRRLAAVTVTAGLSLALAAPADAQSGPTSRLDELKAQADQQVDERLERIRELDAGVAGAPADCGHNAAMRSQLAADASGLEALNAEIQAETVPAEAAAASKQIFTHFRIYMLETPKARQVVACDRVVEASDKLTALEARIQARVHEAEAGGKDVAGAQAALDTMTAEIASATASANEADDTVIGLKADMGDRAVLQSNQAALDSARQDLRSAHIDLQDARGAARTAIDALASA